MAVRCPGCGREYDVTLFAFGRTLRCACGGRVGQALARAIGSEAPPRFAADAMLGRLARWLRVLGYDTTWRAHIPDAELVREAVEEGRIVLTRDRRLPEEWWIDRVVVLESDDPLEQLAELAARLGIDLTRPLFTRCTLCNAPLEAVSAEAVADAVPERVRAEQDRFVRCPGCGRVYWEGSHTERMRQRLRHVAARARGRRPARTAW